MQELLPYRFTNILAVQIHCRDQVLDKLSFYRLDLMAWTKELRGRYIFFIMDRQKTIKLDLSGP